MKAKRLTLLMIYTMLLFIVACSASEPMSEGVTDSPDDSSATPEAEFTPVSPDGRVKIRLENISDMDFEQIEVQFKGHSEQFAGLAAGEMSEERAVEEAYQAVYVKLMADGQDYVLEALDGEGEPPITGGSYIYQFDLRDGTLLVDLMPDKAWGESSVAPVIEVLQAAGATVSHQMSTQRQNIFDELFGYTVATRELLRVNESRVAVYLFDDAATAKEASETILPGGTSFAYTREDGTTVEQFEDRMIGQSPSWWLFEHFIINHGDLQPPDEVTVALISGALQRDPINVQSPAAEAEAVQIRIVNLSQVDFERVVVNFLGQEVDYGAVPSGKQSSYQTAQQAYHYAWVEVEANGQSYQITPIDYVGETPLPSGQYSYLLDIVDEQLHLAYLPEGEAKVDADLVGSDWYWVVAQTSDNSRLFPMIHEEHPSLRFTDEPDPNMPGLSFGGYAGCNGFGGAYHVNQYKTLMIAGMGMTATLCEAIDSETFFLNVLDGINYYSVQGDYLFLSSRTGDMMTFTRQQPTSEPPYATDSHAAIAPIVQAIYRQASEIEATLLSPSDGDAPDSSKASWNLKFFGENVTLYVFDDAAAASEASKSILTSDSTARLWQDERFLISYEGDYDLIDDVLNDIFGESLAAESPSPEQTSQTEAPQASNSLSNLAPIATAPQITVESWAPDSQFLTYRAHSASDLEQNPQFPPGAFRTLRTEYKEMRCSEMVDYNQRRPHVWIDTPGNNMQLLFVTDRDEVVIWPACSDERASLTDVFPELPQAFLATDESGSQFVFAGETSYWLNDANMLTPRQITGLEVMPWRGASWSPGARYVALSQINNDDEATTYLIDVERAEVVQATSWLSPGGKGGPGGPDWLSEREFLIHSTRDRGPLLVTVDGQITEVAPELFGVLPRTEDFKRTAVGIRDEASGSYHIVLAASGIEASFPSVRLYHAESGEVEELPFNHIGSPVFSPDGEWLILQKAVEIQDEAGTTYGTYETWLRSVHPPGSEATLLVGSDYNYLAWSPDFSQVAATSDERLVLISIPDGTMKQEWRINRPTSAPWARAWSPNGKWLVVHQSATADGEEERLFVVPAQ